MDGVNEGGRRGGEDGTQGHGRGLKKKADALDTLRQIGMSAGRGAQDVANSAMAAGSGAAGSSADYLKAHPHAALAATAGAGYLGYRGLKRGAKGAAKMVGRMFGSAPKPPPSIGERLGKALRVLRNAE